MCLYVHPNAEPKILEEDLEVYKVVMLEVKLDISSFPHVIEEQYYCSPFRKFQYNLGTLYSSGLSKGLEWVIPRIKEYFPELVKDCRHGVVEEGLHTFSSLDEAKAFASIGSKRAILRCVVPAGSTVYEGKWEYAKRAFGFRRKDIVFVDSIASDKLFVVEEVKESPCV